MGTEHASGWFTVEREISELIFTKKESVVLRRDVTCARSIHMSVGSTKTESMFLNFHSTESTVSTHALH